MKTYQFTCGIRVSAPDTPWDGELYTMPGILTPPIEADTVSGAIAKLPKTMTWTDNPETEYVVMEVVNK